MWFSQNIITLTLRISKSFNVYDACIQVCPSEIKSRYQPLFLIPLWSPFKKGDYKSDLEAWYCSPSPYPPPTRGEGIYLEARLMVTRLVLRISLRSISRLDSRNSNFDTSFDNDRLLACNINLFPIVVAPINRGVLATMLNKLSNYIHPELLLQSTRIAIFKTQGIVKHPVNGGMLYLLVYLPFCLLVWDKSCLFFPNDIFQMNLFCLSLLQHAKELSVIEMMFTLQGYSP